MFMGVHNMSPFIYGLMILSSTVIAQGSYLSLENVQKSFDSYVKFGACPRVAEMANFEASKIYGKWFMQAWSGEPNLAPQHCVDLEFGDGNPGSDICRMAVTRSTRHYDDDLLRVSKYTYALPNVTEPAEWVNSYHGLSMKVSIVATDYDKFLLIHMCNQFPRDAPWMNEQHYVVWSRERIPKAGLLETSYKLFDESFGEGTSAALLPMDQKDCDGK